ncbi:hypothetical protein PQ455_00190 [Sphingomonas naphthae]|uniref:Uncharacterized protein n=1 Tax=Sphingomonas naphthae TaxID=1813468 RepID=A0ABY7TKD6_9SPHN|nr:hypothetical protein [Sphingomonas naphthae]WCT73687.1 hypothetical protein PQ455_00190 [Sphingomonas naphthae]
MGWSIATLGPLGLSIAVWILLRRHQGWWLLHLLYIPSAIAVAQVGASILFFATDVPDGDSVEGYTLIAAFCFLITALLVHAIALVVASVAVIRGRVERG